MPYPDTTTGFAVNDTKKWSTFTKQELKLKKFEDYDIDIAISACGVCGSDVHTITGGWSDDIPTPLCVGHEIIGTAIKVGSKVTTIKVGDRVGVGAQIAADMTCHNCKAHQENYCVNQIDTYGAPYPDGTISQGGYSSHVRAHEYFTFKIPDNIPDEQAAPMLCAGLTTFSPMSRQKTGPNTKLAVCGLGGLGHFAVMWGVALGANVTVISHTPEKEADAKKLGAHNFISTQNEKWHEDHQHEFDYILNTADNWADWNLENYFSVIKINGFFQNVGLPDHEITLKMQQFMANGCYIGTSHIGNREEMIAMLDLASTKNVQSWVETIQIGEEGCKEAVERLKNNDRVRYRLTLVGYDKVFGQRT